MTNKYNRPGEPYGCFSNFARYPIKLDGDVWATSEHYLQAAKFLNESDRQAVQTSKSSLMAARIGRDRRRLIRSDWNAIKDEVMMRALRAKFDQHSELREILISTHGADLVEHTRNDSYWGVGGDGSGRNQLGKLLVQLRTEYIERDFDVGSGLKRENKAEYLSESLSKEISPQFIFPRLRPRSLSPPSASD